MADCGNEPKRADACRMSGRSALVLVLGGLIMTPAWSAQSAAAASALRSSLFVALLGVLSLVLLAVILLLWRSLARARKHAERVQQRLGQYENMAGNLPIGLHEVVDAGDAGVRFVYVNDRALELWGVSRREAENDLYTAFANVHPDDRERVVQANERARAQRKPFAVEARYVVEGRQRWLRIESWPRQVKGNETWPGCTTDVTDRREAELRFRLLFEQSPLSIILHDADTGAVLTPIARPGSPMVWTPLTRCSSAICGQIRRTRKPMPLPCFAGLPKAVPSGLSGAAWMCTDSRSGNWSA